MRDPHLLARRAECDPTLQVQPMRAGVAGAIRPALAAIELGNQDEPAMLGGIQVPCELGDLGFELIERTARRGREFRSMEVTPEALRMPILQQIT